MASIFNEYFATIGVKLANKLKCLTRSLASVFTPSNISDSVADKFTFQPISEEFVLSQLRLLKPKKAVGLDGISSRLLKDSADITANSLTKLFNRSLSAKIFPVIWKQGKVTPLFKSINRCDPNNYRPITVLPTLSKILEKAVHDQLYSYLNENKLITTKQFGFRPKLSTGVALAHFTDKILNNMDTGRITGAVFLDLSKAFDTVDHAILLNKLKLLGLDHDSLDWFISYLMERSQATVVGSVISSAAPMSIGVPQGSLLGPLLFIVYVNDLPSCNLQSDVLLYADDTVLYYSTDDVNVLEDKLNTDLATLSNWFFDNLLTLNTSKCKFMVFGSSQKLKNVGDLNIYVNQTDNRLSRVESFKYLGVIIQQNMSWTDHIDSLYTKINQRLGVIRRVKQFLPLHARITLYNSLISPLFNYADFVWGDKNNIVLMSLLQTLQNKAAKTVLDVPIRSSATEALVKLGWKTLDKHRLLHRVIMAFKYLHGHLNFIFDVKLNRNVHNYGTRRRNDVRLPLVKRNWGQQQFIYHIFKDWNNLALPIREIQALPLFKTNARKAIFI